VGQIFFVRYIDWEQQQSTDYTQMLMFYYKKCKTPTIIFELDYF